MIKAFKKKEHMKNLGSYIKSYGVIIFLLTMLYNTCAATEQIEDGEKRLKEIHKQITLLHGDIEYEYPEQLMSAIFMPSNAKVLELGSDLGRNTCVIASILNDSSNLVTLEPRIECIRYLTENRDYNRFQFHIECAALSKVPLIQKGWFAIPSDTVLPEYRHINTVTFDQLQKKYGITFDTIVADCEGGLYYVLKEEPEALENVKLIIMENDFACEEHYQFVCNLFRLNGLSLVYNEGYVRFSGNNAFYQVWKKQ